MSNEHTRIDIYNIFNRTMTEKTYTKQEKITTMGFLFEIPSFIILAVSSFTTGSVLVWLDFLDSLCYLIQSGVVAIISNKLNKNLKYEYNYGIERIEISVSLFCDVLLCIGTIGIAAVSVYEIFNPVQPSSLLIYVVLLKLVESVIDGYLFVCQRKLYVKNDSPVIRTEYYSTLKDLLFDLSSFMLIGVCYILRNNNASWYFGPSACLVCSILFLCLRYKDIRENIRNITDKTVDEDIQLVIIKSLTKHEDMYEKFNSVKSHKLGNKVYIDIDVEFSAEKSYAEICEFRRLVQSEVQSEVDGCIVSIRL